MDFVVQPFSPIDQNRPGATAASKLQIADTPLARDSRFMDKADASDCSIIDQTFDDLSLSETTGKEAHSKNNRPVPKFLADSYDESSRDTRHSAAGAEVVIDDSDKGEESDDGDDAVRPKVGARRAKVASDSDDDDDENEEEDEDNKTAETISSSDESNRSSNDTETIPRTRRKAPLTVDSSDVEEKNAAADDQDEDEDEDEVIIEHSEGLSSYEVKADNRHTARRDQNATDEDDDDDDDDQVDGEDDDEVKYESEGEDYTSFREGLETSKIRRRGRIQESISSDDDDDDDDVDTDTSNDNDNSASSGSVHAQSIEQEASAPTAAAEEEDEEDEDVKPAQPAAASDDSVESDADVVVSSSSSSNINKMEPESRSEEVKAENEVEEIIVLSDSEGETSSTYPKQQQQQQPLKSISNVKREQQTAISSYFGVKAEKSETSDADIYVDENRSTQAPKEEAADEDKYAKMKAKVLESKLKMEQGVRKMEALPAAAADRSKLGAANVDVNSKLNFEAMKFGTTVVRGPNTQTLNRNLSYEDQLSQVRAAMMRSVEKRPHEISGSFDASLVMPRDLKCTLLAHQCYSLKWLKWRESEYPHGAILADDMGLGKTLTILAYLKLVKDEMEDAQMGRSKSNRQQVSDEDNENSDEDVEIQKKKKTSTKRIESSDEDEDEDEEMRAMYKTFMRKKSKTPAVAKSRPSAVRLRTLVVLPASLLGQWQKEIKSKLAPNCFKIHVYHEQNRRKFAYNMEDNDIVFTTYEIVAREVPVLDKDEPPVSHHASSHNDSPLTKIKWHRIILDEAHRIKNDTAKVSKAMCSLRAKYRIAITGTPVHNSLNDLYSLVKFLHFEPFDNKTLWGYVFASEKFKQQQTTTTGGGARAGAMSQVAQANAAERESRMETWLLFLSHYLLLRRAKTDTIEGTTKRIVDLPEKQVLTSTFSLNTSERFIYDKIFKESQAKVNEFLNQQRQRLLGRAAAGHGDSSMSVVLVYLLRLRQACCHMSLLSECLDKDELQAMRAEAAAALAAGPQPTADDVNGMLKTLSLNDVSKMSSSSSGSGCDGGDETAANMSALVESIEDKLLLDDGDADMCKLLERSYMSSKLTKVIEMCEELLDEHPEDKIIIVSQWTSMLGLVAACLDERSIEHCTISGDVMLDKRNEIVDRFNSDTSMDVRVMLLSLTAGGVGLNLVGANRMFLLDIHWNPALEQQCSDRIYRVGQKKDVTVYRLLCEKTIEERIQQVQQTKIEMANRVCNASLSNIPGMAPGSSNTMNGKLTSDNLRMLFADFN